MRAQCRGTSRDDEEHDDIREGHAEPSVNTHPPEVARRRCLAPLREGLLAFQYLLLDLLRCLPKEKVGRDGGAQNGADEEKLVLRESQVRYEGVRENLSP